MQVVKKRLECSYIAGSYVDETQQIKQVLFQRTPTGRWIMSLADEDDSFMTVPELIDSYKSTFKKPMLNPASEVTSGIINKWRQVNNRKVWLIW